MFNRPLRGLATWATSGSRLKPLLHESPAGAGSYEDVSGNIHAAMCIGSRFAPHCPGALSKTPAMGVPQLLQLPW